LSPPPPPDGRDGEQEQYRGGEAAAYPQADRGYPEWRHRRQGRDSGRTHGSNQQGYILIFFVFSYVCEHLEYTKQPFCVSYLSLSLSRPSEYYNS
jgi:hypothetical protein